MKVLIEYEFTPDEILALSALCDAVLEDLSNVKDGEHIEEIKIACNAVVHLSEPLNCCKEVLFNEHEG